jgi:glycerol-3-phosphate O-acyltransferase
MNEHNDGLTLKERYGHTAIELAKYASKHDKIDATNVYQEANPACRRIMDGMMEENLLPGSRLEGKEHFRDFFDRAAKGERGLILMEHYSSVDLPLLCYLLDRDMPASPPLTDKIVSMATVKLNEDNPLVKAWAESFSRIVVYPSRKRDSLGDTPENDEEIARSRQINMAAMRALDRVRKQGKVVLVFPSGTRFRPWAPETRRGVREIDSYLRMFDMMIFVAVNGAIIRITPEDPDNMLADLMYRDQIVITASPVRSCDDFRKAVIAEEADRPEADLKQATADKIMAVLGALHDASEAYRTHLP